MKCFPADDELSTCRMEGMNEWTTEWMQKERRMKRAKSATAFWYKRCAFRCWWKRIRLGTRCSAAKTALRGCWRLISWGRGHPQQPYPLTPLASSLVVCQQAVSMLLCIAIVCIATFIVYIAVLFIALSFPLSVFALLFSFIASPDPLSVCLYCNCLHCHVCTQLTSSLYHMVSSVSIVTSWL